MTLIDRLEAASGPDRELDELIAASLAGATREVQSDGRVAYHRETHWVSIGPILDFTASLDAALTLAPDLGDRSWIFLQSLISGGWQACVGMGRDDDNRAPTAALAICIAALKARQDISGTGKLKGKQAQEPA